MSETFNDFLKRERLSANDAWNIVPDVDEENLANAPDYVSVKALGEWSWCEIQKRNIPKDYTLKDLLEGWAGAYEYVDPTLIRIAVACLGDVEIKKRLEGTK